MSMYTIPEDKVCAELEAVMGEACRFSMRDPEIARIALVADGRGLSGEYDRVHVLFNTGAHLIYPAHNLQMMRIRAVGISEGGVTSKILGLFQLSHPDAATTMSYDDTRMRYILCSKGIEVLELTDEQFDNMSPIEILIKAGVQVYASDKDFNSES